MEEQRALVRSRIRARRSELRLTQKALAARLGVSYQQVQKYESGSDRVSASMLMRIAEQLECSASALMGEGPQPPAPDLTELLTVPGAPEVLDFYEQISSEGVRQSLLAFLKELARTG